MVCKTTSAHCLCSLFMHRSRHQRSACSCSVAVRHKTSQLLACLDHTETRHSSNHFRNRTEVTREAVRSAMGVQNSWVLAGRHGCIKDLEAIGCGFNLVVYEVCHKQAERVDPVLVLRFGGHTASNHGSCPMRVSLPQACHKEPTMPAQLCPGTLASCYRSTVALALKKSGLCTWGACVITSLPRATSSTTRSAGMLMM